MNNKNIKGGKCFHNLVFFWLGLGREEGGLMSSITPAQFNISHKEILEAMENLVYRQQYRTLLLSILLASLTQLLEGVILRKEKWS